MPTLVKHPRTPVDQFRSDLTISSTASEPDNAGHSTEGREYDGEDRAEDFRPQVQLSMASAPEAMKHRATSPTDSQLMAPIAPPPLGQDLLPPSSILITETGEDHHVAEPNAITHFNHATRHTNGTSQDEIQSTESSTALPAFASDSSTAHPPFLTEPRHSTRAPAKPLHLTAHRRFRSTTDRTRAKLHIRPGDLEKRTTLGAFRARHLNRHRRAPVWRGQKRPHFVVTSR